MYTTNYHRASSVEDAVKLLGEAEDGKVVSGGMTLIPAMKTRLAAPSDVIDLRHIASLKGITVSGRAVTIGAGTTHAEVADSKELAAVCHSFCHMAGQIGDPHVSLAVRSPTTIRPPIIPPRCWRLAPRSSPTGGRSLRRTSSPACSRPRWRSTRSSRR